MSGTMHPYYTVALAPGIAGTLAIGGRELWRHRDRVLARATLALMVAATAVWSFVLLAGSSESYAWVRWVIAGLAVLGVVGLLAGTRRLSRVLLVGTVAAVLTGLVGTSAYAVATASVAHTGSIPSAGATSTGMGGMGGPDGTGDGGERPDGGTAPALPGSTTGTADAAGTDQTAGFPGGGGGMGGEASAELTALLSATDSTWSAAVGTSRSAAGLELASGTAVMSLGGWSGSDSAVTLEQFQQYVANGQIHYYVGGGQGGPGGSADGTSSQIAAWVEANFTATTVGSQIVYDLAA
jgi:hypothetical protein